MSTDDARSGHATTSGRSKFGSGRVPAADLPAAGTSHAVDQRQVSCLLSVYYTICSPSPQLSQTIYIHFAWTLTSRANWNRFETFFCMIGTMNIYRTHLLLLFLFFLKLGNIAFADCLKYFFFFFNWRIDQLWKMKSEQFFLISLPLSHPRLSVCQTMMHRSSNKHWKNYSSNSACTLCRKCHALLHLNA